MIGRLNELKNQFSKPSKWEYRTHQIEALEQILDCPSRVIVLKAPPGSGKSLMGMVMLRNKTENLNAEQYKSKGLYLVHSKALQDQLNKDYPRPESMILYGRSNYPCNLDTSLTAADCPSPRCKDYCEYKMAKKLAQSNPISCLNYSYYLTETNYIGGFGKKDLVVIDEADMLDKTLEDFITLTISERQMENINLRIPEYRSEGENALADWRLWAEEGLKLSDREIGKLTATIESWGKDQTLASWQIKIIRDKQRLETLNYRFEIMSKYLDKTWICSVKEDKYSPKWEWKPIWMIPKLAEKYLWRHSKQFFLMSGTMPPKPVLALLLGIPENDIEYFEVKSDFPPENRPIHLIPSANMVYKQMAEETPKVIKTVEQILAKHPKEKGIIHTVSYSLTQEIMKIGGGRLITHNSQNKQEILNKFQASSSPLVFVSPSSERGLDLFDDLCRFIIMCKAPYLSLSDKLVSKRVYGSKLGERWYRSEMLNTTEQASCRGMRHKEDYCHVYILDQQIIKAIQSMPSVLSEYFRDSMIYENAG